MGSSWKWPAALLAALVLVGLGTSARNDSCVETRYSGGRLIECESMAIFQPSHDESTESPTEAASASTASIPLPPSLMALLGALLHGGCKTSKVPEGQWTVCEDGFSLLERGTAFVATALLLKADEDPVAKAEREAAAARADIDLPVEDSDCGPFPCSDYVRNEENPKRDAYLLTLSSHEIARLGALIRAWEDQEIVRELAQARAENTALQDRLKEIAAHEAALDKDEPVRGSDDVRADAVAQANR